MLTSEGNAKNVTGKSETLKRKYSGTKSKKKRKKLNEKKRRPSCEAMITS